MKKTWKQKAELALIAAVALGTVDACAPAAKHTVGEMMVGTGGALVGMATGGMDGTGGDPSEGTGGAPSTGSVMGTAGQMLVDAGMEMMGSGGNPAVAQEQPNANGTRLQLRYTAYRGADGLEYQEPTPTIFDTQLGVPCHPTALTDGALHCVPYAAVSVSPSLLAFADSSCTRTVFAYSIEVCPGETKYAYEMGSAASCAGRTMASAAKVYRIGAAHAGNVYQRQSDGGCTEAPFGSSLYFYEITEVAPSEFVRMDATTSTL